MNDYVSASMLGFSFGNLWLCVLLLFSLQTTNRATCGGYLLGRALTILGLALAAAALGHWVSVDKPVLNLTSGALFIGFGLYLVATRMMSWVPPWKRLRTRAVAPSATCNGHCSSCPTQHQVDNAQACRSCDDKSLCAAEEPEIEPLTRRMRRLWHRDVAQPQQQGFLWGMTIGGLRGAALCGKLAVLLPVLLQVSMGKAFGIALTFSLSSSVYPLLGIFFGTVALRFVHFKRLLLGSSCVILTGTGVHYLCAGLTSLS